MTEGVRSGIIVANRRQIGIWRRAAAVNACTVRRKSMGHWVEARYRSCVKTLPPRGRCPSAHTGADEEWRYLSFSNAVRKNGCNRKIVAILTGCSQHCNLSPFLIRLAFGDPPSPRGKVLSAARANPNLSNRRTYHANHSGPAGVASDSGT